MTSILWCTRAPHYLYACALASCAACVVWPAGRLATDQRLSAICLARVAASMSLFERPKTQAYISTVDLPTRALASLPAAGHNYDDRTLKLRLSFARGFLHFTDQEWDAMIFSDEVHFCLGHHGQVWVQRPPGAAYDPQYCKPPDEALYKVTLWGCFCSKGIGAGRIFEGELNKQLYRDILEHNFKQTYQHFYPHQLFRFLQDNASPHYNPEVNTWMHNHGIHILEFPPRSPDLNPIENLWHVLKWRVEHRNPSTAEELELHLREEYEAVSEEECRTLARSMHDRLLQCIAFEGHKTKY